MPPSAYPGAKEIDGLKLVVVPVDSPRKLKETFGTDLKAANIIPFHLIVENSGRKEFEITQQQMFGISENGEYTVAYNLNKAAEHVRSSSIGTTAVTNAVAGAIAGVAVGAAVGATAGHIADDTSQGAETGALIGGTVGATSGAGAGLSDSYTVKFKKELANLAFEDRVVYPGDIQQGFIYFKWQNYRKQWFGQFLA
ncbi:hypothetical protein [Desulfobacter latus]|uniref:Glycine zipper domain-containing protein n=1 Tax=Desulfobacter latus TaxID=2292 RepID=A0A850T059_9BACT|nr:hypothetical protein [Desulfobacter latus]NWH06914.1 hypothetical protein [Desulfobacter latus]